MEGIRRLAADAREKVAAGLFDLNAVRDAVTAAASAGFDQVMIRPPLPLDLRRTEAARAAIKFLTDGGAFATWEQYTAADDLGHQLVGYELRIGWGEARL